MKIKAVWHYFAGDVKDLKLPNKGWENFVEVDIQGDGVVIRGAPSKHLPVFSTTIYFADISLAERVSIGTYASARILKKDQGAVILKCESMRSGPPVDRLVLLLKQHISFESAVGTTLPSLLPPTSLQPVPIAVPPNSLAIQHVSLLRQYEYLGGKIRVKVKIVNAFAKGLLRLNMTLDVPSSFKLLRVEPQDYPREGASVKLGDLLPKEEKAAAWVLEPLICGKERVGGTVSGMDPDGIPFASPMEPLAVEVRCPLFVRPEDASLPAVQRMLGDLPVHNQRAPFYLPKTLPPSDALEVVKRAISERDVTFVGTIGASGGEQSFEQSVLYYGVTKVGQKRYVITASVSERDRAIRLETACDDEAGCTGFLAEAGARVRRELVARGAVDSEGGVKELICEKCGCSLPRAPVRGDVQCPECQWVCLMSRFPL